MGGLTQQRLKELFKYDPETGAFTRRVGRGSAKAGAIAGYRRRQGYLMIRVGRHLYYAHRLVWLYMHGKWPDDQIDHINGVRDDNRLSNLREATPAQNMQNMRNKKDGLPGSYRDKKSGRWVSRIGVGGEVRYLGRFDTAEEAHEAYARAKVELHPFSHAGE